MRKCTSEKYSEFQRQYPVNGLGSAGEGLCRFGGTNWGGNRSEARVSSTSY